MLRGKGKAWFNKYTMIPQIYHEKGIASKYISKLATIFEFELQLF